jgi:ADP-ribosylglycohydrolase/catechol 2,3-dioxygenase-like lactoylglutathione lyase family enzyme
MNTPRMSISKAVGVFAAAAVGDALGWPQENRSQIVGGNASRNVPPEPIFRGWERNGGTSYSRYTDPVQPGEYSDDTQLLLAVARACLRDEKWYEWLTHVELPVWPTFERGGGGAVLAASRAWADKRPPWISRNQRDDAKVTRYHRAGANGVAMRIAPHAIATAHADASDLMTRVIRDGLTTHGHPRALIGACVHALAIRYALREDGTLGYGDLIHAVANDGIWRQPDFLVSIIDDEWTQSRTRYSDDHRHPADHWIDVVQEVDELLAVGVRELGRGATGNDHRALEAIGCFDKTRNGSGTVTAAAALYVASRTAPRPMSGLLRTGYLSDADTDTLCSMTGSLLGAIQGPDWLGHLFPAVQDSEYIINTAIAVAEYANGAPANAYSNRPSATTSSQLRRWSDDLLRHHYAEITPDGRPWQIQEVTELPTRTRNTVTRIVGVTIDGQTLVHDKVTKASATYPRNTTTATVSHDQSTVDVNAPEMSVDPGTSLNQDPQPSLATIELQVADLNASTRFFSDVLGFNVETADDRTRVGDLLVLARRKNQWQPRDDLGTVITVLADDPEVIATRAASFPGVRVVWSEDRTALWIKEPGLNTLRVVADRRTAPTHTDETVPKTSDSVPPTDSNPADSPSAEEAAFVQDALFDNDQSKEI